MGGYIARMVIQNYEVSCLHVFSDIFTVLKSRMLWWDRHVTWMRKRNVCIILVGRPLGKYH